jgi:ABC-2 type transport system ATP-binding protein
VGEARAAIETWGLRKQFDGTLAVADLSVEIRRGEIFGFLGPNGAGKTTAVNMLLGLVPPTSGEAFVLGFPLGERLARKRIGFLPEHCRFHECLTAREFLRAHGRLYGLRGRLLERRIRFLLERLHLPDAADRQLATFSKGMLQRAGLAQAMLAEPELLFLDEPTSGLDPLGRILVRDLIRELRGRGTTIFLNSHLLGEVEATCDRVAFLKRGRIVRELLLAEGGPAVDVTLKIDRMSAPVLDGLGAFGAKVRIEGECVRLEVAAEEMMPKIAAWLVGQGVGLYSLGSRRKSLEEWFIEIMGDDQAPG